MAGNHERKLTTNLKQIKESTHKLETLFENMKSSLIKSIISDQDTTKTE